MTDKPYTDADVEMVASTFVAEAKKNPIAPSTPPWFGAQTRMLLGPTEHDIARAVLDALAAAGRLAEHVPPGLFTGDRGDRPAPECLASMAAVHADCDGCTCSCHRRPR